MTNATAQRRPKGTGSVRHKGGDRWQVTVKLDGTCLTRVFRAPNQTAANRAADGVRMELMAEHKRHALSSGTVREQRRRWTVERYANYYLDEWAPKNLAATTLARYREVVKAQIVPHLGKKRMAEVTVADVVKMQAALATDGHRFGGGLSKGTITKVHNVLGAIFTYAVDIEKDFPTNPVHDKAAKPHVQAAEGAREGAGERRALSLAEVGRFVELARSEEPPEVFAAILLSARLGLRRGEALGVQWQDVDFDAKRVTICRAVAQATQKRVAEGDKRTTKTVTKTTKTTLVRHIPIGDDLCAELRAIQVRQAALRLAADPQAPEGAPEAPHRWQGGKTPAQDHVAARPNGALLEPEAYTSRFRALCKRHKIVLSPHGLRHSWCSNMIALGYDAVNIASMSGHSPDVLLKVYAHAFDCRKREAIDAFDAAWKAASGE